MTDDPMCACGCPTSKHRPYEPGAPWATSIHPLPAGIVPPSLSVTLPPEYTHGLVWCPEAVHVLHYFEDGAALARFNELHGLGRELSFLSPFRFRRRREIRERMAHLRSLPP